MYINFSNGFISASNRHIFILSIIASIGLVVVGAFILIRYPKTMTNASSFEGLFVECDTINKTITIVDANMSFHMILNEKKRKKTYNLSDDDICAIRAYVANNIDSIIVRIWAEKKQARQIEMNGTIVKQYDWWKYAKPALWMMILPGSIFLILLILDRKRLLKEPESKK